MGGGGGREITDVEEGGEVGLYYSQESQKNNITFFRERAGRIFREGIKVYKMYTHKDLSQARGKNSWFTHVQFSLLSNWLKRKGTLHMSPNNFRITFKANSVVHDISKSMFDVLVSFDNPFSLSYSLIISLKSLHLSDSLMIQFYCKLRAHFYLSLYSLYNELAK